MAGGWEHRRNKNHMGPCPAGADGFCHGVDTAGGSLSTGNAAPARDVQADTAGRCSCWACVKHGAALAFAQGEKMRNIRRARIIIVPHHYADIGVKRGDVSAFYVFWPKKNKGGHMTARAYQLPAFAPAQRRACRAQRLPIHPAI